MLVKGFKQFNEEKTKSVTFTFGRFNPPTIGHEKLITQVIKIARGGDYKIFVSQSNNPKSDPLQYKEKVGIMRKMFPKYARNIILDAKLKTVFDISVSLYKQGYTDVTMVIGSDRIKEFKTLLLKYNGTKARHGFYEFDNISFESAGERDPDSDDVSGMSASKMRAAAVSGDFQAFADGLPKSFGDKLSVFNLLRKRMGLKEMANFRKHIQLPTVSEKRESYIAGEIFNKGDKVYCQKSNAYFTISERYSNYVVSSIGTKYLLMISKNILMRMLSTMQVYLNLRKTNAKHNLKNKPRWMMIIQRHISLHLEMLLQKQSRPNIPKSLKICLVKMTNRVGILINKLD